MEKLSIILKRLHDATFFGISLNWENESLLLHFEFFDSEDKQIKLIDLQAESLYSLDVSIKNEWGKSCSVNQILLIKAENFLTLSVEIQSGDVILIQAQRFSYHISPFITGKPE